MFTGDKRVLFIGGLHKSGTTVFQKFIASHPNVSGFEDTGVPADEGQHLQSVYPSGWHGKPGHFGFIPSVRITEESTLVTETNRRRLESEWGEFWEDDARVLVEKSPPNMLRMRFLQALFPGATFITLMRHPIYNALATKSMCRWPFGPLRKAPLWYLLSHWVVAHHRWNRDKRHIHQHLTIKYEQLVDATASVATRLGELLDVNPAGFDQNIIDRGANERYRLHWAKKRQGLPGKLYANVLESLLGPAVERYGYSIDEA